MFNPISTYRIQFHKNFTFSNLEGIIPYLEQLGIKTLYASPIFKAVPGSNHGYDVTDPLQINPEIGTLNQLKDLSAKLKEAGISWLQDIVPNHMAFHQDNVWLMDVLKHGSSSPYRSYFDQSLADESLFKGKIMVPFLGDSLETVISNGEISVVESRGEYFLKYAEQLWPANIPDGITINNDAETLSAIADAQHYRLCSWRETNEQINYRRFFTVNGLICLNMHNKDVFEHYHQLISQLLEEGIFQGLRVDHIDGLYDPELYLQRLRKLAGDQVYIVVEKILEESETLPQWPIQGTTGYDFLAQVNNLFTDTATKQEFTGYYDNLVGPAKSVDAQILDKKELILRSHMQGELENLTNLFIGLGIGGEREIVKEGIALLLVKFPVYRFYGNTLPLNADEQGQLTELLADNPCPELKQLPALDTEKTLDFYRRCMQFSGPLMAKGVEDTLMYTYNRFIGHNEVGDAPAAFGITTNQFHELMQKRQELWPLAQNGTATHDTKRGESARTRLNALTHFSADWFPLVDTWRTMNANAKQQNAPDANDEYFIYQTLVGACPVKEDELEGFTSRLKEYLQKMLREAKTHSNWDQPNEAYETAVFKFAERLIDPASEFWKSFYPFLQKIDEYGKKLSEAQVVLKLLCPGVPDIYQGCELDDYSFVDPDNRRPVDYEDREKLMRGGDERINVISKLLKLRASNPELFEKGTYLPIEVQGTHADKVLAFARVWESEWILVIVPVAPITDWDDTFIVIPNEAPRSAQSVITIEGTFVISTRQKVSTLIGKTGFAVFSLKRSENPRSAGILLHITSLPSSFGSGDMGPSAYEFADVLRNSGQRLWQVLPLNAVHQAESFSPYSPVSSQAGNILLISPELLLAEGLVGADIFDGRTDDSGTADFASAMAYRQQALNQSWQNYKDGGTVKFKEAFDAFCDAEMTWLKDFAVYSLLKEAYEQKAWHQWPNQYKFRDAAALEEFEQQHRDKMEAIYWQQFVFNTQWNSLKSYCNAQGIQIFGDLPFYISYDSVDVWANPNLFKLDKELNTISVSGVPPDYFNEDGQRWGTPVYDWEAVAKEKYWWWIKRIQKNLQWFDLLRLDHFRAFSAYWEVPAEEPTAKNGAWIPGPGAGLFDALKEEIDELPLVAEDLGDIDDAVYELKDKYELPGMKVLQFAFGNDVAASPYVTFNHEPADFVYTGTHDNNTTRGWFHTDADQVAKDNLSTFTGIELTEENAAEVMIREALRSVGETVVVPMQDWLNLDETFRMNTPAGEGSNWTWRLTPEQLASFPSEKAARWITIFGRA